MPSVNHQESSHSLNPNVAYPRREKTRQSVPNVAAHRLGQDEQYLTVREILSELSTLVDGALSRERNDFYRFGYATLGLTREEHEDPARKTFEILYLISGN